MHQSASHEAALSPSPLTRCDSFPPRHLGSSDGAIAEMLATLGLSSLDELIARTVPAAILNAAPLHMALALKKDNVVKSVFVSERCHPQTIAVVQTRAEPLGVMVIVGDEREFVPNEHLCAVLVQYPDTHGGIRDYAAFFEKAH